MKLFTPHREAVLVSRPNRFLIYARLIGSPGEGEVVACHCPNPGRLLEFRVPGTHLILEERRDTEGAKTRWTAAAVRYRGAVVPLYSARANQAARELVIPALFPELRDLRAEFTLGRSRFDFFALDGEGNRHLIEVKACTLVEKGVAMFPDAPSERAVKHLAELALLADEGYKPHVLFIIMHGNPLRFVPNLHTDPAFASAMSRLASKIAFHGVVLHAGEDGTASLVHPSVPVDLGYGALAEEDRGSYLVVWEVRKDCEVEVPFLGMARLSAGWYIAHGFAPEGLASILARYSRILRKHPQVGKIVPLPIAGRENLEAELVQGLVTIGGAGESPLCYFSRPPLEDRTFLDLVFTYRHR